MRAPSGFEDVRFLAGYLFRQKLWVSQPFFKASCLDMRGNLLVSFLRLEVSASEFLGFFLESDDGSSGF